MDNIVACLKNLRINVVNEEFDLQKSIAQLLAENNISFQREYRLARGNRVDFFAAGIVIEVKKGKPNRQQVIRQLERYAEFDEIKGIILVVETKLDVPREISGKPCMSLGLNKLWGIAL